jgi:RNA polymerase sigma factor (sigma-70 family)
MEAAPGERAFYARARDIDTVAATVRNILSQTAIARSRRKARIPKIIHGGIGPFGVGLRLTPVVPNYGPHNGTIQRMSDMPEISREDAGPNGQNTRTGAPGIHAWFVREVLPLEAALTGFLRNNRQSRADVADLLQDIYVRVYEAARTELPTSTKSFVFTIAHNLLVDRIRRDKVVPLSTVESVEALGIAAEAPGPDETTIAREELGRVQAALEHVSPRSREAILLRQVEGLSRREIAARMSIS